MINHIRAVHDKIRHHMCSHCDYMVDQKVHLTRHIKAKHEKIKDQKCLHCDFTSSLKSDINSHIKSVHMKIRDHKCSLWKYASSRNGQLTTNIMTRFKDICDTTTYFFYGTKHIRKKNTGFDNICHVYLVLSCYFSSLGDNPLNDTMVKEQICYVSAINWPM